MQRIFYIICLLSNVSFSQGLIDGYMKGKGNTDMALSYTFQNSKQFWGGNNLINIPRSINAFGLFVAHGINRRMDVIANIPFINKEFQDGAFVVKCLMLDKTLKNSKFSAISAFGISTPLMKYATENAQAIGQRATQLLPKIVIQWTLNNGFFVQTQSGYNYAFSPVPSSIPFSIKIGLAKNKIYTDIWYDFQQGLGSLNYPTSAGNFRKLTVNYQRIGGVLYFAFSPKFGLFFNGAYTLSGRNTSKSYALGSGFVLKFSKKTVSK